MEYTVNFDNNGQVIGYYENGYYYFYVGGRGSGIGHDSPQITRMNSLGNGSYYLEFTTYYVWDIDLNKEIIDSKYWLKPLKNWPKEVRNKARVQEKGFAVIKDVQINGKKTWNLIKFGGGNATLSDVELKEFQKL